MVIEILSVQDETFHPNLRLMEEGRSLGYTVRLVHTRDCLARIEGGQIRVSQGSGALPDVLLPRIGATINDYALSVVRQFELAGVRVVNGSSAIALARNKFLTLQALSVCGLPVPDSFLPVNMAGFQRSVDLLGGYPVVAKVLSGRQGTGVTLVESPHAAEFLMNYLQDNTRGILVQRFYPPQGRKDVRVLVVGGEVVGALTLRPGRDDFRSNIHREGRVGPEPVDPDVCHLAVQATGVLGLVIAGVDLIVDARGTPRVIEINYSPGFRGLEKHTGLNVARHIMKYLVETGGPR